MTGPGGMTGPREPLRRVVVAGDGQVGLLAAIAMRRAMPGCDIVIMGAPSGPADLADRAATALPFTNRLHDRLGIAEEAVILQAGGSHRLVTRFFGWDKQASHGAMPYGGGADRAAMSGFAQAWGDHARPGESAPSARSLAEILAQNGRFAVPPPDRATPISHIEYGLRWHPAAYRELLIGHARQLGVSYVSSAIASLDIDEGGELRAVIAANEQRIDADLYLDCTGREARLLSGLPGYAVEDWSGILPRIALYRAVPGQPMAALEDRLTLLDEGWLSEFAGRDGLQLEMGAPLDLPPERIRAAMGAEIESRVELQPGCVRQAWIGNVIAIGDAAARLHPLLGLPLDLAHRQIDLLLEMLPGRVAEPVERSEYNRRSALIAQGACDSLGAFYAAPRASRPFGATGLSERLDLTLDQFRRRGRIPLWEEAPLLRQELAALLRALGFGEGSMQIAQPANSDAAAREFAEQTRAAVAFAPPYAQWLAGIVQRANAAGRG